MLPNRNQPLLRTSLFHFHVAHGGRMVPFAGWEMPVQYSDMGVLQSHLHVREKAGLFDVSHMLQTIFTGPDRNTFLSRLLVADLEALEADRAQLSLLTNERGGIIDDCVVQKWGDKVYLVSNAGTRAKDLAHIRAHLASYQREGGDVQMEVMDGASLLALQGPQAASALASLVTSLSSQTAASFIASMPFMSGADLDIGGVPARVTRCGYTGEDGFEISLPHESAATIAESLLSSLGGSVVKLAGLGPRDSLRLEAGLCLYGHDVDDNISPVEAGLTWTIPKSRRSKGGFLGSDVVLSQIKSGPARKRVGLFVDGAPAREGAPILNLSGEGVGKVTSGGPSPSLRKNIAMGYVPAELAKLGTELKVEVRGKRYGGVVVKMPFVPTKIDKGPGAKRYTLPVSPRRTISGPPPTHLIQRLDHRAENASDQTSRSLLVSDADMSFDSPQRNLKDLWGKNQQPVSAVPSSLMDDAWRAVGSPRRPSIASLSQPGTPELRRSFEKEQGAQGSPFSFGEEDVTNRRTNRNRSSSVPMPFATQEYTGHLPSPFQSGPPLVPFANGTGGGGIMSAASGVGGDTGASHSPWVPLKSEWTKSPSSPWTDRLAPTDSPLLPISTRRLTSKGSVGSRESSSGHESEEKDPIVVAQRPRQYRSSSFSLGTMPGESAFLEHVSSVERLKSVTESEIRDSFVPSTGHDEGGFRDRDRSRTMTTSTVFPSMGDGGRGDTTSYLLQSHGNGIWSTQDGTPTGRRRSLSQPQAWSMGDAAAAAAIAMASGDFSYLPPGVTTMALSGGDDSEKERVRPQRRFSHSPQMYFDHSAMPNPPGGDDQLPPTTLAELRRRHSIATPFHIGMGDQLSSTLNSLRLHDSSDHVMGQFGDGPRANTGSQQMSTGPIFQEEIDDYFENPVPRQRAWLEGTRNLQYHTAPRWPAYVVEFKAGRKDFFHCPDASMTIHRGDFVIVEADRGKDLGKVIHDGIANASQMQYYQQMYAESMVDQMYGRGGEVQPKRILRLALQTELAMLPAKIHDEELALATCQQRVKAKRMPMEVVDAEYQWDRRKLTYYFVADRRIDFRELVRELFKIYKTRIWLCACVSNAAQGRITERQILGQLMDGMGSQDMPAIGLSAAGPTPLNMAPTGAGMPGAPPQPGQGIAPGLIGGPPIGLGSTLKGPALGGLAFPSLPTPGASRESAAPGQQRIQPPLGSAHGGPRFGSRTSTSALDLETLVSSHERTALGKWKLVIMPPPTLPASARRRTPAEIREEVDDELPSATEVEREREVSSRLRTLLAGAPTGTYLTDPDSTLESLGVKGGEERTVEVILDMGSCHSDRSLKRLKEGFEAEVDSCTTSGGAKCKSCGDDAGSCDW
ncbi:hypothetical protein HDU93_009717 [Gonapodya sp. JEL0774]|nr:hypothetical protein HDU93_009717 [Gonapodya sp. JEL0774]